MAKLSTAEKEFLATRHYKIVYAVAHEFKGSVPFDELESIALLGFAKALDSFDKEKSKATKAKFATYARRCMRNEVVSFLRKENKRMKNETYAEQAYVYSNEGKESLQVEVITKEDLSHRLEDDLIHDEQMAVTMSVLSELNDHEKYILTYRYGLFGNKIKTQKEIAEHLHVSQASVSKSQHRIEAKLKKIAFKHYDTGTL